HRGGTGDGTQARNLASEAQDQLRHQTSMQQKRSAEGLRALGSELRSMAGQGDQQQGVAAELVHQAADWLEQREPGQVLDEGRTRLSPEGETDDTKLLSATPLGIDNSRRTQCPRRRPPGWLAHAATAAIICAALAWACVASSSSWPRRISVRSDVHSMRTPLSRSSLPRAGWSSRSHSCWKVSPVGT